MVDIIAALQRELGDRVRTEPDPVPTSALEPVA